MKKRIIATILVVVMTVLSLASCGSAFSFADEDMAQYTDGTFDITKFLADIKNIEIKDGEFTTDEAINDKKVVEDIYEKIATAVIKDADNDYYKSDKLESGNIEEGDVVYFCYFAKDEATGNYFMLSDMQESSITASATKANHFIKLGNYDEDDGFMVKLAEALLAKKDSVKYYSMQTKADLENVKIESGDIIVVSYDVEYTEGEGEAKKDYKKTADYETISLDGLSPLSAKLLELTGVSGAVVNIGDKVQVPSATYNGESDKSTVTSFDVVDNGITYKYSNFTIDYKIDSYVSESDAISFKYTDKDLLAANCDNLRNTSDEKIELKDKELTYYVYPVYRLDVPAVSTEAIIEYVYGKTVKVTSNELFGDEGYVYTEGETTTKVSALIEKLGNIWNDKPEAGSGLESLLNVKKDADQKVTDSKNADAATKAAADKALDDAENAYYAAKRNDIRDIIKKIAAAKKGDEILGAKLFEKYTEDSRHTLKEEYNTYITETVGKKVWELINKQVVVTSYPEELVKEFSEHLYESYEAEFYNGSTTTDSTSSESVSNYTKFEGNFKKYLMDKSVLNVDDESKIDEALEKKAKENLEPIIKIYFIAQKLNAYDFGGQSINDIVKSYVEKDIAAGIYEAHYEYNSDLSEKQNKKAEAAAKEQAEKNIEAARKNAEDFLVTDEVFKEYKKDMGRKSYRVWAEQYGEINIRAALQFDKLFYFLVSTDVAMTEDGDHSHQEPVYVDRDGDGKKWISFRTVSYKFPAEE